MIFRFVGAHYPLKNILVCKWWYNIAEPIALEDVVLPADALINLPQEAHKKLASYVQRLDIDLYGARDGCAKHNQNQSGQTVTGEEWSETLVHRLDNLSELLPRCTRLGSFSLRLKSQFDPSNPLLPREHYLSLWSPTKLVDAFQATNLSHLVIDTCGSEIKGHICPRIALAIPSLRSVRLRMQKVCPRILGIMGAEDKPSNTLDQSKAEQRDSAPVAKVERIIINLCLKEADRFFAEYSRHCTKPTRGWDLYDEMVTAATETAKQFTTLKVMRILCHKHPLLKIITKDCIYGSKMVISDDGDEDWDWGDDGWADPDDEEVSSQGFSSTDSESSED